MRIYLGLALLLVASCRVDPGVGQSQQGLAAAPDPGALVSTTALSTVGVLLDEIPASMRARVAADLAAKPAEFWKARAAQQLRLTAYRLVFREFYYGGRKQLPLPPEPLWNIRLIGAPRRDTLRGHDVVRVDYELSSTLLTDVDSPAVSEPRLKHAGGTWDEPFELPIDPEMVLQRTGFACMDEEDFPFHSVDSEEVDSFYDQDCTVERDLTSVGQCHHTQQPAETCIQALDAHVGRVSTFVRYTRLAWDGALAQAVRLGKVTGDAPDLEIYLPDFVPSRVVYRYIHDDGCERVEQCVRGSGWRRLLQFATSDENVGNQTLTIGGVDYTLTGQSGELDQHNLFEFSACHRHYHFKYYGDFTWQGDQVVNSKKGFCLQSTARVANRETSPLHNPFGGCDFQGVEAGWVDQYKAGLPCQWLDITGFGETTGVRGFKSNPNGFICEGTFVDAAGQPIPEGEPVVWAPTGLIAENGEPVEAPLCALDQGWEDNNAHTVVEHLPADGEGLITTECARGQIGPLRNCGFHVETPRATCAPDRRVRLTCSVPAGSAPQVVRFCEYSHALGSPVPCLYEDTWVPLSPGISDKPYTLASAVVGADPVRVTFTCPGARTQGAQEPGGAFALYAAPVYPGDAPAPITCR